MKDSNDLAKARGTAQYPIIDLKGNEHNITLENALSVPNFPVSILSAKSAADYGAKATFTKWGANLIFGNVTFEFIREGSSTSSQLCMYPFTLQDRWNIGINLSGIGTIRII